MIPRLEEVLKRCETATPISYYDLANANELLGTDFPLVTQALMKAVEGLTRLSKREKFEDWETLQTYDDIVCLIATETLAEIENLLGEK